jgi:ATP-dependent protease ClpP protease subunit
MLVLAVYFNISFLSNLIDKKFIALTNSGSTLVYIGHIDEAGVDYVKDVYKNSYLENSNFPTVLHITSPGGDEIAGLAMGNWVWDKQLDVVVKNYCLSACANYVFVAGQKKILKRDSIIGWHGNSLDPIGRKKGLERAYKHGKLKFIFDKPSLGYQNFFDNTKRENENITDLEVQDMFFYANRHKMLNKSQVELNISFYTMIEVDPQLPNYGFHDKQFDDLVPDIFFYYSLQDLEKMGIGNIVLRDGIWEPSYRGHFYKVDSELIPMTE